MTTEVCGYDFGDNLGGCPGMLGHSGPHVRYSPLVEKGSDLYHALKAEGFELPEECGNVEMIMPIDGVFQLRYTVNVEGERLVQLGRALVRLGELRLK